MAEAILDINRENYDHINEERLKFKSAPGLTEDLVRDISKQKQEPEWMLKKRLDALKAFKELPMPKWGPNLSKLDLSKIHFFIQPDSKKNAKKWEDLPEDIRKTYEKLGIPEAEEKSLAGVGAQYECLSGDTIVYTNPDGPKPISKIKVNEYVFALDEKEKRIKKAKVLGVKKKGKNQLFELVVDNKKIRATANHPFLTLRHYKKEGATRGRYRKEWSSLKDLKEGDLIAIAKSLPHEGKPFSLKLPIVKKTAIGRNQFGAKYILPVRHTKVKIPQRTSNNLMWLLGLYQGDGYIKREKGKDKKRVFFAIPESQPELRAELKNVVNQLFNYSVKSEHEYYLSVNSTIIADFIEANGFKGNAHKKRVPKWIFKLPKEQMLEFLAGYTDSDGYPTDERKSNVLIFRSVNNNLINDLRNVTIYCGLHPSNIHTIRSKHPFERERIMISYQIDLSGDLKKIKCRYPPKAKRLNAKKGYKTYRTAKGTVFRKHTSENLGFCKIKSIRKTGIETVYDIEVENYHNFIAEGLIVHNSEVVYHNLKKEWEKKGIVFLDCDEGLRQYPELFKKYFMTTCVSPKLHKFTALHAAVWSGGTFIYIPKGVKLNMPLQAYFRMNAKSGGQFEHTLIIVDEGAEVQYIEGCSAPQYTTNSLHAGCVEIHVLKGARARYSSIENWSKNTYNLNTKRAVVHDDAVIEWVNGNMGSAVTMLYPASILKGDRSKSDFLGVAFASKDQNQDTGTKVIHIGKDTSSTVTSKSISKDGGITSYRGLISIRKGAVNASCNVECDALMMDSKSKSNTHPYMDVKEKNVHMAHEARVGKISDKQIFYLMSRGLDEESARKMIVTGFIEPIVKELPLEYAVELNRLIELEMDGALG